ncbi:hypothetical protein GCM10009839_29010 [Catenulispora yoronensis]|uniref:Uncharacterized protein n=1 Tax=Catenulispora yoronensis TaxID=450799 RepID=A0ABP5FM66_9ACTN
MAKQTIRYDSDRGPSAKPLIVLTVLAVLLLVAVPISILVALFMIVFGHVTGGFAVIGVTLLAAIVSVVVAGASGIRHLQRIVEHKSFRVVQLGRRDYHYEGDNCGHDHSNDEIRII